MFNYAKSIRGEEYTRMQQELNQIYGREIKDHFNDSPRIAGVDHGPLIILENVSVMRFLLKNSAKALIIHLISPTFWN